MADVEGYPGSDGAGQEPGPLAGGVSLAAAGLGGGLNAGDLFGVEGGLVRVAHGVGQRVEVAHRGDGTGEV